MNILDQDALKNNQRYLSLERRVKKKHKGCTEPLYGKKAKCVIKIVPHDEKCKTLEIDEKCIKKRA